MPRTAITGTVVTEFWEDESESKILLNFGTCDDTGDYVSIKDESQTVYIKRDTWLVIRKQIDELFYENSESEIE